MAYAAETFLRALRKLCYVDRTIPKGAALLSVHTMVESPERVGQRKTLRDKLPNIFHKDYLNIETGLSQMRQTRKCLYSFIMCQSYNKSAISRINCSVLSQPRQASVIDLP